MKIRTLLFLSLAFPACDEEAGGVLSGSPDAAESYQPACPDPGTPATAANLMLGQDDFTGRAPNAGGESAASLYYPFGVASDGSRLWIGDAVNARLLQWNALPTGNGEPADIVIGQDSFTSHERGRTADRFEHQSRIHATIAQGKLLVTDGTNNRILIWNEIPAENGTAADLVLGQPDFTTLSGGVDADQFSGVKGIWSDGTRIAAADWGNHRVLIWATFPTSNGQPADLVVGQPDFGVGRGTPGPASATSLAYPEDVFSDGTRLYVIDGGNNRVLIWNTFPMESGRPADLVIGQGSLTGNAPNGDAACPSATTFSRPMAAFATAGTLAVADRENHRVLLFDLPIAENGAAASGVIGQSDFTSGDLGTASAERLNSPSGLTIVGSSLYVSQPYWNRVSRFSLP